MYFGWAHYYIPKVFSFFSFLFNPLLIFLITTDKKNIMGSYKYLLLFFALFDIIYSILEFYIPMGLDSSKGFLVFIADGYFSENYPNGHLVLAFRSSFIGLSYGLLLSHFIYRYLILFNHKILEKFFQPSGIFVFFFFFSCHGFIWIFVCEFILYVDEEVKDHFRQTMHETYQIDINQLAMFATIFHDANIDLIIRTNIGLTILVLLSIYAITAYFIFAYLIMKKLHNNIILSKTTRNLQKQLFKTLVVQTFIPIFISFFPCMVAWYLPFLRINIGIWNNNLMIPTQATFPCLDPLAIIIFIPNYRHRLFSFFKMKNHRVSVTFKIPLSSKTTNFI